jgi:hypothetical protein
VPLPVPNLDDKRFDELAAEARALIPRSFPAWTDHNPSDPGITLLELFAFLVEAAFYQLDRLPEPTLQRFAELVGIRREAGESVDQLLRRAVTVAGAVHRAVTPSDVELIMATGLFSVQPPPAQPLNAGAPASLLEPLPATVGLSADADAGMRSLTIAAPSGFRAGDLVLLDDEARDRTELARVETVATSGGSTTLELAAQLGYDHDQGATLSLVAEPTPPARTALARRVQAGDTVVVVDPTPRLRGGGVLRLGSGPGAVHVRARGVARARAIAQATAAATVFPADQVVKVLLVPDGDDDAPVTAELAQAAFQLLRARGPVTTRVQVAPPRYREMRVEATVVRDFATLLRKDTVQQAAEAAVRRFLSPLRGGDDGHGWEFGRSVYRSELYQVLESTAGVDHVQRLLLDGDPTVGELQLAQDEVTASGSLVRLTGVAVSVVDA